MSEDVHYTYHNKKINTHLNILISLYLDIY